MLKKRLFYRADEALVHVYEVDKGEKC